MKTRTKVMLYSLFVGIAFDLALYLTFPWASVGKRIEYEAQKAVPGLTLVIGTTAPAFPLGIRLADITVLKEGANPGDKPLKFGITEVVVKPLWTALVRGKPGARVFAEAFLGALEANVVMLPDGPQLEVVARTLQLDDQGVLESFIGGRLSGALSGRLEYTPGEKGAVKDARLELGLAAAQFAGATIKGFTVPPIDLGTPTLSLQIENGEGKDFKLVADSKDVNVSATGTLSPRTPVTASLVKGPLKVKLSESWLSTNPKFRGLLSLAGTFKKPDGSLELPLSGPLTRPLALPGF